MSISFNGTSQRLSIGSNRDLLRDVPGCTLMSWCDITTSTGGAEVIVGMLTGTGVTRAKLSINTTGTAEIRVRALDADGGSSFITPAAVFTFPTALIHIAAAVDFTQANALIYINGVLNSSGAVAVTKGNTSNTATGNGSIASVEAGGSAFYRGRLEDVRIYGRALGPGEIQTIWATKSADGIVNGLQARWPLADLGPNQAVLSATDISKNSFGASPIGTTINYDVTIVARQRRRLAGDPSGAVGFLGTL